jgi:hypothetical protein
MAKIHDIPVTFILSTGRTGTQFFARYLTATCPDVYCLHEPHPSRRFKWYSNFYLNGKLSSQFIGKQFVSTRNKILKNFDGRHYVESSNFIFGCMNPVAEELSQVQVLHLVRHPLTYIRSHLNKGFWNGIKGFTARHIPGWLEFIDKEIRHSKDPVLILAARWIYVNQIIRDYENNFPYLVIRFEDLFSEKAPKPTETLNHIRAFVECPPLSDKENDSWLGKPSNQSVTNRASDYVISDNHKAFLQEKAADLLTLYDYKLF